MASWSKRRKSIIAAIVIVFAVGIIGIPVFLFFYKAPTCFDGKKNGSELEIDCGGSCARLCQNAFLEPNVAWARFEEVAPGLYNLAAYVVNPNAAGEALDVPYHMVVYDNLGMLIVVENGIVTLPPHRNTLAFKSSVSVGRSVPAKIMFEFTAMPNWRKSVDLLQFIRIGDKDYNEDETSSSLSVALSNEDVLPLNNVSIYVVLYDKDGNALGFSKTLIDEIPANGKAIAPFTWPIGRQGKVISIEVLPVAE